MLRKTLFSVLGLCIFSVSARAVLPPSVYLSARQTADHHVQVAVTKMTAPWKTPGTCVVEGVVATVFRSKGGLLKEPVPVTFGVDCLKAGDEPGVGGVLWGSMPDLKSARFIEVYLNGAGPERFAVAKWQYVIIEAPSKVPACPPDKPGLTCW